MHEHLGTLTDARDVSRTGRAREYNVIDGGARRASGASGNAGEGFRRAPRTVADHAHAKQADDARTDRLPEVHRAGRRQRPAESQMIRGDDARPGVQQSTLEAEDPLAEILSRPRRPIAMLSPASRVTAAERIVRKERHLSATASALSHSFGWYAAVQDAAPSRAIETRQRVSMMAEAEPAVSIPTPPTRAVEAMDGSVSNQQPAARVGSFLSQPRRGRRVRLAD